MLWFICKKFECQVKNEPINEIFIHKIKKRAKEFDETVKNYKKRYQRLNCELQKLKTSSRSDLQNISAENDKLRKENASFTTSLNKKEQIIQNLTKENSVLIKENSDLQAKLDCNNVFEGFKKEMRVIIQEGDKKRDTEVEKLRTHTVALWDTIKALIVNIVNVNSKQDYEILESDRPNKNSLSQRKGSLKSSKEHNESYSSDGNTSPEDQIKIQELNMDLKLGKIEVEELKKSIESLNEESNQLKNHLQSLIKQLNELQNSKNQLEKALDESAQNNGELSARINNLASENQELKEKLSRSEEEFEKALIFERNKISGLNDQFKSMGEEKNLLLNQIDNLNTELERQRENYREEQQKFEIENQLLKNSCGELNGSLSQMSHAIEQLTRERNEQEAQALENQQSLGNLKQQFNEFESNSAADLEGKQVRIDELAQENQCLTEKYKSCLQKLDTTKTENEKAIEKINIDLNLTRADNERLESLKEQLESNLKDLTLSNQALQEQLKEMESESSKQIEASRQAIAKITAEMQEKIGELENKLREKVAEAERHGEEFESQRIKAKAELLDLQERLNSATKQSNKIMEDNSALRELTNELEVSKKGLQTLLEEKQNRIQEVTSQNEILKQQLLELEKISKESYENFRITSEKEIKSLKDQLQNKSKELITVKRDAENLQDRVDDLSSKLRMNSKELQTVHSDKEKLFAEKTRLDTALETLKKELEVTNKANLQKQASLNDLEKKVKQLSSCVYSYEADLKTVPYISVQTTSLCALQDTAGWEVVENLPDNLNMMKKTQVPIVAVYGSTGSGMSWLSSKLSNNTLPYGWQNAPNSISAYFIQQNKGCFCILDASGCDEPIRGSDPKTRKLLAPFIKEKKINEDSKNQDNEGHHLKEYFSGCDILAKDSEFIEDMKLDFMIENGGIIILVINKLTESELERVQKIKRKLTKLHKKGAQIATKLPQLFIVHNLSTIRFKANVEAEIQKSLMRSFQLEKEPLLNDFSAWESEKVEMCKSLWKDETKTTHLVIAADGTEAGDYYNPAALKFLLSQMEILENKQRFDFMESFVTFCNKRIPESLETEAKLKYSLKDHRILCENKLVIDPVKLLYNNPDRVFSGKECQLACSGEIRRFEDRSCEAIVDVEQLDSEIIKWGITKKSDGWNFFNIKGTKKIAQAEVEESEKKATAVEYSWKTRQEGEILASIKLVKDLKYQSKSQKVLEKGIVRYVFKFAPDESEF